MNSMFVSTAFRPHFSSSRTSTAAGSISAKKRVMPFVFLSTWSYGVVRVRSNIFFDSLAFVIKTFRPETT